MSLLLEALNLEKSFGDRLVLNVKDFKIYSCDRIGFVGANGSGKTTFLNILSGKAMPDTGRVTRLCDIAYAEQFGTTDINKAERHVLSRLGVGDKLNQDKVSGGENTRLRLAAAIGSGARLLIADEPTSNLDSEGIAAFGEFLSRADSFIVVSHDRAILNEYCNKIIALENADIVVYSGGFDDYARKLKEKKDREFTEYERYASEKDRLSKVYTEKKYKAAKMTKAPKNMTSSERKMREFTAAKSFQHKQKSMDTVAKAVLKRVEHMDVKEKPRNEEHIRIDISATDPPGGKTVIWGGDITFSYGERMIFNKASFSVTNKAKVVLYGPNGSGKTTLLNLINSQVNTIHAAPKAKIGYFYQGFENIDFTRTVLENAVEGSVQTERIVRSILARLLFKRDDVFKRAGVLSGGERIKLSLAKLMVQDYNVLMLDEPTNYLDMPSIQVLESMLKEYEGTLLFVSHDRAFADSLASEVLAIKDNKFIRFEGPLEKYLSPKETSDGGRLILEHRLAELAGKIEQAEGSLKEGLEEEYRRIYRQLSDFI